mmetsp:Transcript_9207/g.20103  ORF Transcript_9207/g.20103 Transcript_9207/m.20103 type:complete len:359 (-) Transcript_9207:619-1695(-)
MRKPLRRLGAQGFPPLADLHALQGVPLERPAELGEDDQRAPQGPEGQPAQRLLQAQQRDAQRDQQAQQLQKAALRPVLLPRSRAGKAPFRTHGVEHSVRIQRHGSGHLQGAAGAVPGPVRRNALGGAQLPDVVYQLRGARDGLHRPAHDRRDHEELLQPRPAHLRVPVRQGGRLLLHRLRRGRPPRLLPRIHRQPAAGRVPGCVRHARERSDRICERRDLLHVRHLPLSGGHGWRGRLQCGCQGEADRVHGEDCGGGHPQEGAVRHRGHLARLPCGLRRVHEHGLAAGVHPLQQADRRDGAHAAGAAQGAQGAGGDVERARGHRERHRDQPGARRVGRRGLPQHEAPLRMAGRPHGEA